MRLSVDSTQKHILLLKLVDAYENVPDFGAGPITAMTPQREWLSKLGAIFSALDPVRHGSNHKVNMNMLSQHRDFAINSIVSQIGDAIEEIRLDLELDGESDIGSVYEPGDVYRFFKDLKSIISTAQSSIILVDAYLGTAPEGIKIEILSERYIDDVKHYADKHKQQFKSEITLRKTKEIHDRLLIIDQADCWIIGNSIKDAAKKSTYLIPLAPSIASSKIDIYGKIWDRANKY